MKLAIKAFRYLGFSKRVQLFLMRMTQDRFLVGVTGVIFDLEGRVLLLRHTYRRIEWSLPGGYMKGGEHPREALEREVKEECGLVISADKRLKIRTDREGARLDVCYVGTYLGGEFVKSEEVAEAKFFRFEELPVVLPDQLKVIDVAMKGWRGVGVVVGVQEGGKLREGWRNGLSGFFWRR